MGDTMGIDIRTISYDDPQQDNCCRKAAAILELDNIRIPLCEDCLNKLTARLSDFNKIIFCKDCCNFMMNKYGLAYDGSCKKKALDHGVQSIPKESIGFDYWTGPYDTCKYACSNKNDTKQINR